MTLKDLLANDIERYFTWSFHNGDMVYKDIKLFDREQIALRKIDKNCYILRDYSHVPQELIDRLITARVKYDISDEIEDYNKFVGILVKIHEKFVYENSYSIDTFEFNEIQKIIEKNLIVFSNIQTQYSSTKIIAELNGI